MGRPPCCDKVGVKKGPWTPEEDIMLMSFVQEHGPGNWRAVPTKTGLKRCSKSCRLRWTNYLRPGIKRGSFNDQEEKMIIQLQALLGNKWAAIASYLPERTDNDIKNYWNTHLKKKLNKLQNGSGTDESSSDGSFSANHSHSITRGQWERTLQADINTAKQALHDALLIEDNTNDDHLPEILTPSNDKPAKAISYASSTDNIARLLKQWAKKPSKSEGSSKCSSSTQNSSHNEVKMECAFGEEVDPKCGIDLSMAFESLFGFEFIKSSNSDEFSRSASPGIFHGESKPVDQNGFASMLENWPFDDQGRDYLTNLSFDENLDLY